MRTSSGPNRPSSLHIRGSSIEGSNLEHIGGGSGHPAIVIDRVFQRVHLLLMEKGGVGLVRLGILEALPT